MARVVVVSANVDTRAVLRILVQLAGLELVELPLLPPGPPGTGQVPPERTARHVAWLAGQLDEGDLLIADLSTAARVELHVAAALLRQDLDGPAVVLHARFPALAEALGTSRRVSWLHPDFPILTMLDLLRAHAIAQELDGSAADLSRLTPRERSVVELAADGLSDSRIAEELEVSPGTVKTYVARSKEKLGLETRDDLRGAVQDAERRESS